MSEPTHDEMTDDEIEEALNAIFATKHAEAKRIRLVPAGKLAAAEARIAELEAALRPTIDALYDTHGKDDEPCPICRQIAERAKATLQK